MDSLPPLPIKPDPDTHPTIAAADPSTGATWVIDHLAPSPISGRNVVLWGGAGDCPPSEVTQIQPCMCLGYPRWVMNAKVGSRKCGELMVPQADAGKSTCVLNRQKNSKYNCLGLLERKRKQSADNSATLGSVVVGAVVVGAMLGAGVGSAPG